MDMHVSELASVTSENGKSGFSIITVMGGCGIHRGCCEIRTEQDAGGNRME